MRERRIIRRVALLIAGCALAATAPAEEGRGAALSVSPAVLAFTATANGAAPAAQTLAVTASSRTRFSVSASVQSGGRNWLTVTPSGTLYTNQSVSVTVNAAGVAPGNYQGRISLSAGGTTVAVPVTLAVVNPVSVSPTSLTFSGTVGGAAPASRTISVTAPATASFTASATVSNGSTNWLTISPSGSLTTNRTLTVSVNPAGLAANTYQGTVAIAANGATTTVPVTLTLTGGTITVAPTSLTFSGTVGSAAPASQTLAVTAAGATSFTASASTQNGGSGWLSVSPSGSLTTNRTLTVSVNLSGLAAGTYNGAISLVSGGGTRTVPVTLTLTGGGITVAPTSLTFSGTIGGAAPATQTLAVTAAGATSFTASASTQNGGSGWLSVSPSGSLTTNRTLTVSVNLSGLAAGTYNGAVSLVSGGSTRTVPVTLTLTGGGITVAPTSLTFSGTIGGAAPATQTLAVTAAGATSFTASASTQNGGSGWLSLSPSGSLTTNRTLTVSVNVSGLAAGTYNGAVSLVSGGGTRTVPVTFLLSTGSGSGTPTGYKVISWNDLGMHCDDGQDYSIFGVLPPYNTIHAHLIDSAGKLVVAPAGYTLTYQAINDPLTNTLNTSSALKTNFWKFATALGFGILAPDVGLKGYAMPGASNTPQAMGFSAADNTWVAEGIPLTNYPDSATGSYTAKNYFPMMRVVAKNANGTVLASTDVVLPISDELTCAVCHSSTSLSSAAQPAGGWVTNPDPAKEMKLNILRKHDELSRSRSAALFTTSLAALGYSANGLEATATTMKPVLCAGCHATNALGLSGVPNVPALTTAMHSQHATVVNPNTNTTLDAGSTRDTCYLCHPGPNTQCLRGAMATLTNPSTGAHSVECQSCHGTMKTVATAGRSGWLDEPNCQGCHTGTATSNAGQIVFTSVFSSGTTPRVVTDATFATNANTPAAGISLYRFSKGHGGLQCEACHGSTHAEFPTPIVNDNVQSTNLQGHAGMLAECTACHSTTPTTTNGGPHGLHPIGTAWVSQHQRVADSGGATACQACHGTDYRGTVLSKMQADRTMAGRTFARGTMIGCYSCHNGPGGGD